MPTMKPTEFWLWMVPSETRPGKLVKTRHRMTEQQARERHGAAAQRVEGSCEVREMPETPEEAAAELYARRNGVGGVK